MVHLGRQLQKRIVVHRFYKFGRSVQSASRAKPSPVHTKDRAEGWRDALNLPVHLLASRLFSAQRSEHETNHLAVNLHMSSAVNRSRGGFSRLWMVDSYVSRRIPMFHLKNRRSLAQFTKYRQGHCFTDFLKIYVSVIPQEQHSAVGKQTGETAHVERWNNTLRQRLARFVRMTLSFSKSDLMHEACLLLFLHRYNLDRAILLK